MAVDEKHILIAGASRGFGCATANLLRSSGNVVYTTQRTPPLALTQEAQDDNEAGFWHPCDFVEPAQSVELVQKFVDSEIKLDGILFCTSYADSKPKYLYNTFDFQRHMTVNVIGPTMLLIYLEHHEVLKFGAPVIFLLDDRRLGSQYLAYGASRKALRPFIDTVHKTFPLHSDVLYISPPEPSDLAADTFTEAVLKIFKDGYSGLGRVLDLE